jgi:hypothetical protein
MDKKVRLYFIEINNLFNNTIVFELKKNFNQWKFKEKWTRK